MRATSIGLVLAILPVYGAVVAAGPPVDASTHHLFKEGWIDGTLSVEPAVQVQALGPDTFVIRQSIKTNLEAPFLYLLFGEDRALLLDTGAGGLLLRPVIDRIIAQWLTARHRASIPLIVAHSHNHRDHIAGDQEFRNRPNTTVVGPSPEDVANFFKIERWPEKLGHFDLGARDLRIIPAPGHQIAHIMIYDPRLKILLSGDALYPGRLYIPVNHMAEARSTISRLSRFVDTHPVRAVLGAHIEMTRERGRDVPQSARAHFNEHRLELSVSSIAELQTGLQEPLDVPGRPQVHDDFIIYPMPPRE